MIITCWCGNTELLKWNEDYFRCPACETLLASCLRDDLHALYQPEDTDESLYGSNYWFKKTFSTYKAMGCANLDDAMVLHYRERAGLWLKAITRHLLPPARVLEIGCGLGTLVRWMKDLGYTISALELSAEWCAYLTDKLGILVETRELAPYGPDDSKLDSIIMMDVLEHVAGPSEFLARVGEHLQDGGTVFIQTPRYPEGASFQELQTSNHRFLRQLLNREHLYLYSLNALKKIMASAGFEHSLQYSALGVLDEMFLAFSGKPLHTYSDAEIQNNLMSRPESITAYAAYVNYLHVQQAREEAAAAKNQCQAALGLLEKIVAPQPQTPSPFGEYMRQLPKIALPDDFSAATVNRLLYLRLDGIGDTLLANSLLEKLPEVFPKAKISVVCDQACAAVYEACPLVDDVMPLKKAELKKQEYFNQAVRLVKALKADAVLHALASPTASAAALALAAGLPVIGLEADTCNMSPEDRAAYNEKLALKVAVGNDSPAELKKYETMLTRLGSPAVTLQPKLWLNSRHVEAAQEIWKKFGLVPEKTIALFASGQSPVRDYALFGEALAPVCKRHNLSVAALGAGERECAINAQCVGVLQNCAIAAVNLSGECSLLTSAALLASCRLAVGVETGLAHMACALGVPQVILLGGGHFGRFMPCSTHTTAVCLPLECYGCNWRCRYERPYCINGIAPEALAEAIEAACNHASPQSGYGRILMQAPTSWKTEPDKPRWRSPDWLVQRQKNEEQPIAFSTVSVAAAGNASMKKTHKDVRKAVALVLGYPWARVSTVPLMTAHYLADRGYQVDLFVEFNDKAESRGLCLPEISHPNIRTHTHAVDASVNQLLMSNGLSLSSKDSSAVIDITRKGSGDYAWLIGFDPGGLVRVAALSERWGRPYVYHSLEIEDASSPWKPLETACNANALYTLTQDACRADILSRLNKVPRDTIFISVNSSLGETLPERDDYFRELFPAIGSRTIILAVGALLPETCVDELVVATHNWPEDYVLVLHGWLYPESFGKTVKAFVASVDNVFLSENLVPPEQKFRIFQSVDACLAFFSDKLINTRYAAYSAGKIYDCMRCGIPVIGNDIPGMRDLVEKNGIGLVVRDASQLHAALPQIMQRHDFFRRNCLTAFPRYEFSTSYAPILRMTERLVGDMPH